MSIGIYIYADVYIHTCTVHKQVYDTYTCINLMGPGVGGGFGEGEGGPGRRK